MKHVTVEGPEQKLLLCCARLHSDRENERKIEHLLQQDLNWTHLIRLTHHHGMLPALYSKIRRLRSNNIPDEILTRMRDQFRFSAWRNIWWTRRLLEVLDLLESNGIVAIPFKGPTLALSLYENSSLRSFGDLDLLVRREDFEKAGRIFLSSGYIPEPGQDGLPEHEFHSVFVDQQGLRIEIHWALARPWHFFNINTDLFWQRKETMILAGRPVPLLCPEDLLLALSVHGIRHHWRGLRWACDLGRLLERHKELDWSGMILRAKPVSRRRVLLLSVLVASDLTGAEIHPNIYRAAQRDPIVPSLASWTRGQLFSETEDFSWRLRSKFFYVHLTSGAYWKFRLLLSMVSPTPSDVRYRRLPPVFSVLYYFIRPIRFIRECDLWSSSPH